jgi:NADH:ubiquinone oxidoreductase subunit 2 (subunit N)
MFIGHYGIAYGVKKKITDIPLWLYFASVQLLDLIAFTLVLFGIEKASYVPGENPFFRNHLELPYSHSLSGAIIISLLVFIFLWNSRRKNWAVVLALCVLSHWFIDLIVHTNDLPVFFGSYYTGLGLWNYPYLSFGLEIVILIAGWIWLNRKNTFSYILLILLILSFTGMIFREEPEIMKHNDFLRTSVVLVSNGLFILLAYLSDRKSKSGN